MVVSKELANFAVVKKSSFSPLWLSVLVIVPLLVALLVSASVTASEPAEPVVADEPFADVPPILKDCAGIYIRNLQTGQVVASNRAESRYVPASVTKALTTAAVLSLRDSAERFETAVYVGGNVSDGVLDGDVIIKCYGDPTLGSRHLKGVGGLPDSIATALSRLGVVSVAGRVIVDESNFDGSEGVPAGWSDEDLICPYGAELFGANYRDNRISLSMPSATAKPSTPDLEVAVGEGRTSHLSRSRHERKLHASGRGVRSAVVANPVPYSTLQADVVDTLESKGIAVNGGDTDYMEERHLLTYFSPRFVDIMRSLMVRSDNLMAEGMLRTLAPGEKRADALAEERDTWSDFEIDTDGIMVEDGSGLSRSNRLTPRFLADVLTAMADSRVAGSYIRLFPRVAKEGTVRNFMKDKKISGTLVLKTGSMMGVQSYAGYHIAPDGTPTHVVVFMANGFKCSRAQLRNAFGTMLEEIFGPREGSVEPEVDMTAE